MQVSAELYRANSSLFRGTFDAFARTHRSEGIRGLYRGVDVATFGGVPGVYILHHMTIPSVVRIIYLATNILVIHHLVHIS